LEAQSRPSLRVSSVPFFCGRGCIARLSGRCSDPSLTLQGVGEGPISPRSIYTWFGFALPLLVKRAPDLHSAQWVTRPLPTTRWRPSDFGRTTMAIGTVKWFNTVRGYGFIQPEDGTGDVFVHISAVERSGMGNLHEGQRVSFELERGQRGKTSAVNLRQA
jgi:CspA family cold shock protein